MEVPQNIKNRTPMCVCVCVLSRFSSDSVTLWNVARQAPLPMGFPRQEYWSGLPLPFPGGLPDPGLKPKSLLLGRQILHH